MATKRKTATTKTATKAAETVQSPENAEALATDTGAEIVLRTNFTIIEQDAVALLHAASLLVEADTPEKANFALDHNLRLWIAIKTVLQNEENTLDTEVKANLRNLAQYVYTTTMEATKGSIEARKLVSLSRINMHIAEGLLRGQQNRMVQERAYEIWEREGRPEGREMDHWLRAEAEIADLLKQR
ncbi:DUF2934 domain-containing protein [Azospirillum sp. sgz302134]